MEPSSTPRELRIFISSTFRDMQAERDYLVRQVFPGIRKACQERQVAFTDIDLRWGLTREEAEQGQVVRICLEEVDRCRPYFISLLGERYGWSPVDGDLEHRDELLARFPFLDDSLRQGLSVTEMEILHGVLDNPGMTEHRFFYLRDPALTDELAVQQNAAGDFTESRPEALAKLERLKARIRTSGLPVREAYAQLEELGEWVRQDLLAVLDQRFPIDQTPSPLEAERLAHRNYSRDRTGAYIPSPVDLEVLDRHLATERNVPLVVTGDSGLGKSALLAYWMSQLREQQPDRFIIEHYAGISGETDPVAVLRRIMAEIQERTGDSEEPPGKPNEVIRDFPLWLARVREQDPLILVIDGLNQLESREGNWLPDFWPAMVKPLFSVIPGDTLEKLKERDWPVFELQPLDQGRREQLIRNWLAGYRKSLSAEQTQRLAAAPQTGNPLFLRTVLEELRIFGYFEQLDQRIETLLSAKDPRALFGLVLERLEADFGQATIRAIMAAIWAARRGLTEEELVEITQLNRLTLSSALLAVDTHLARRAGLLTFFHDYLHQAVQLRYLNTEAAQQESHRQLARHFQQQPEITQRVAEELPWQWQQAEDWEALKDCISAIPIFEVLYERGAYELLWYWLSLGGRYDPGECYANALGAWTEDSKPLKLHLANTCNQLGNFLFEQAHDYSLAENLVRQALLITRESLGDEHPDTAAGINNLANICLQCGNYSEAEALHRQTLAIRERVLGTENVDTAESLNNLAILSEKSGNYATAESLYRHALDIYKKIFTLVGQPEKLSSILFNLAGLLSKTGDQEGAEAMLRQVLAMTEKIFGRKHPKTGTCLSNLSLVLSKQGNHGEAESLCQRALGILEESVGHNHPDTAICLINLSHVLAKKGDIESAEVISRRALTINEHVFGCYHPDTAQTLYNLAVLLQDSGNYEIAESLYRRASAIYEQTLGGDHPDTADTLQALANLLKKKGSYDSAEPLYLRVMAIRKRVLGAEHPDIAESLNNLANLLQTKGDFDAAEPLYRQALTISEKAKGTSNPDTIKCLNNLAILLEYKGNYADAKILLRDALNKREEHLGAQHTDTAESLYNLANLLRKRRQL